MLKTTFFSAAVALIACAASSSLIACNSCACGRFYVGAFGGGIYSNSTGLIQTGTAFYPDVDGGPLAVDARGDARKNSSGFGGVQIGYEWLTRPLCIGCSNWSITPAAEVEAYFYRQTKKGELINPTTRLPEHDFIDSFPMNMRVCLINGVFALHSCCLGRFSPYVGGGIGAASLSVRHATSWQIAPPEVGINHFNSEQHDSTWTFVAQVKAGLQYKICQRFHLFAEYRFLFVETSNFTFGSTVYPPATHVPTSPWSVKMKDTNNSAFAFGIQYDL